MNTAEQEIQQELARLRAQYAAELPARLAEIQSLWREVKDAATPARTSAHDKTGTPSSPFASGSPSRDRMALLRRQVHSLAGSGATFGFAALSQSARAFENLLRGVLEENQPLRRARAEHYLQTLIEAGSAAETPAAGPGTGAAAPAGATPLPPPPLDEETVQRSDHPLLLLAGGKDAFLEAMAEHFRPFGFAIAFGDADAAPSVPPAAVICAIHGQDLSSPKSSIAPSVARALARAQQVGAPIVFLGGTEDLESRLAAVRAGGVAYFTDPVDWNALVSKVNRLTLRKEDIQPYRTLIVDDDQALAAHYTLILKKAGMDAYMVDNPLMAMEAVSQIDPELILVDLYMPQCSGLELAQVLRQQDSHASVPIVFLSAEARQEKHEQAMHSGADDFLTKPVEDHHLVAVVSARIERARELRRFVVNDSLTGLLNHTRLKERLAQETERARRGQTPLSYVMIDVDHFKSVNDTHGHPAGDRVLLTLAMLLRQRLRRTDIIGRYGGEEFAVILPDTPSARAQSVMDAIRRDFEKVRHSGKATLFSSTFSAGIASYPRHTRPEEITAAADQALYRAKREGRNRIALGLPGEADAPASPGA